MYILDNILLSAVSFASIFSQSVACLLNLLTRSFTEQKLLIFMQSSSSSICFTGPLVLCLHKASPCMGHRCSPVLHPGSRIVFYFTVRPVIHLEVIFVKCVMSASRFISLRVDVHLF